MDDLCKGFVGRGYEYQQLGVGRDQVFLREAFERRICCDRVYNGQCERQKSDVVAFEIEKVEAANDAAVLVDKAGEEHLNSDLDKLAAAAVYETKHQPLDVAIRSDDRDIAENNSRNWPR